MGNATSSSKAGGAPPNNIPSHALVPPSRDTRPRFIRILHDAENCPFGSAPGLDPVVVYDGAVREICRLGGPIGLPAHTRPHAWHMVLPRNDPRRVSQHPTDRTVQTLAQLGVTYDCVLSRKKGCVDDKLRDLG